MPELLPIAVDFDGTLAQSIWPKRGIGAPIDRNLDRLTDLVLQTDREIVIYTARGWADEPAIRKWLMKHLGFCPAIQCGKFLAAVYIDDRALHADSDWIVP